MLNFLLLKKLAKKGETFKGDTDVKGDNVKRFNKQQTNYFVRSTERRPIHSPQWQEKVLQDSLLQHLKTTITVKTRFL